MKTAMPLVSWFSILVECHLAHEKNGVSAQLENTCATQGTNVKGKCLSGYVGFHKS